MAFINVDDPDENIWVTNPMLNKITFFKNIREVHGDDRSSSLLKAIYYIHDPKSSLRKSGMTESEIEDEVNGNILNDPDFDWDVYSDIIEEYKEVNLSRAEKLLNNYDSELSSLQVMIDKWNWSKDDAKQKADVMRQYKSLYEDYVEMRSLVQADEENQEMRAGYVKSLTESYEE